MATRGLQVYVNIGAKVASSVGASASAVERRLSAMGRRIQLANAEARAASRGLLSSGGIRGAVFDIGALGYGFYQAAKPATEFELALTRLGNTGEVYGDKLKGLGDQIIQTGKTFGYGGREALTGVEAYVAAGLNLDQAVEALGDTLKLSRTLGIDPEEGAQAGVGVMTNMKVAAADVGKAFDRMALAGKAGNFEVQAMAKYMPRLTSAAAKMGMTGVQGVGDIASMLQIVRKGSADEETAQNNLYNLFEKVFSAETVKKFKKNGYDLSKMWATSQKTGEDYFDMVLDAVDKLSKHGENPFAFANTFEDQQAKSALTMLITHREEYKKLRAEVRKAGNVLDADWNRVSKTAAINMFKFKAAFEQLAIVLMDRFLPTLTDFVNKMTRGVQGFSDFSKEHPKVVDGLLKMGVALGGLLIGSKVFAILYSGIMRLVIGARWLWRVLTPLAGMITRLVFTALVPLGDALLAVGVPLLGTLGILAASLIAVGLAVAWVIAKWDGIVAFFQGFADGFMKAIEPVRPQLEAFGKWISPAIDVILAPFKLLGDAMKAVWDWFKKLFAPADVEAWRKNGQSVGETIGGLVAKFVQFVDAVGKARQAVRDFFATAPGAAMLGGGLGAMSGGSFAGQAIGNAVNGKRAGGGWVRKGGLYRINERGEEFFSPRRSGHIIPASRSARMGQGGGMSMGDINIYGATDPHATAQAVRAELRRMFGGQAALLSD